MQSVEKLKEQLPVMMKNNTCDLKSQKPSLSIQNSESQHQRLWFWAGLLACCLAVRLAIAAAHPLFETEAYYWLWSRHLSLGYFDHPPMLAWFNWLGDFWGPPHSLAARAHAVAAHTSVSLMLFFLGRNLYGSARIGLRTAVIYNVIPIYSLLAVQNQPDVPLVFFWVATLVCFERALSTAGRGWWLAAGAAAGGALLSKFHGFFFIGTLLLYLAVSRRDRCWLKTRWPWLAFAAALAVYSPNFIWNARHDWLTYNFQLLRHAEESRFEPSHVVSVLAAPLLYLSPWVYAVYLAAGWRAMRRPAPDHERTRALCLWTSVPLLLFFLAVSFRTLVKIHWPAAAFVSLTPLAAWMLENWRPRRRFWFYAVPLLVTAAMYGYMIYPMPFSRVLPGSFVPAALRLKPDEPLNKDYASRTFGWAELGEALRAELARTDPAAPTFILARRFDRAATAAFWAGRPELAWVLDPGPTYRQSSRAPDPRAFLAWERPFLVPGASAIYVRGEDSERHRAKEMQYLGRRFERIEGPIVVEAKHNGVVWRRWELLRCVGWKGN